MAQMKQTRAVEHAVTVRADADAVYRLIADVGRWPELFPPTVHVEHVERTDREERIQIWATANGEAKTWTSRRSLDPDARVIEFRQERSQPPVAAMTGTWIVEPASPGVARVRLLHTYRAVDDDPGSLEWIDRAVDRNSHAELVALRACAERAAGGPDAVLTFEDVAPIAGTAKDVYDFIDEAHLWAERLPHVAGVSLREDTPGLQVLAMDTRAKDGSVHTTESIRVTFPHHKIVYKQVKLPALLTLHTGEWRFRERRGGVDATSRHTIAIDPDKVAPVLGQGASIDDARRFVRDTLSANSLATLGHARAFAERRR
jgi:aromatase